VNTNGTQRHAAVATWQESAAAGAPLSGAQLGAQYARSARWGRDVIAEARSGKDSTAVVSGQAEAAAERQEAGQVPSPWVRRTTTLAVLAVALVAAVVSYEHMRALAAAAGEGWRAWLVPVSVDGLMVAASMTALTRRRAGQPVGALAWAALLLGISASVAANMAAAEPTLVGRAVASWPPLALGLSFELLLQQGRTQRPTVGG
jgi:hypothetical protein